ncbi:MAG: RNA polymerase sigma factor [Mycobacteriales bacterium]
MTHAPDLTRFLASQIGDASEAQDLMQEVYLRVLKLNSLAEVRSPKAYLFKVAANIAFEHRRCNAALPHHVAIEEVPPELLHGGERDHPTNAPEDTAALAERLGKLSERLSDLPPKVQAAIVMSHLYGYTYEEIGLRLSVVRNRVKKYLIKGLAHCRGNAAVEAA